MKAPTMLLLAALGAVIVPSAGCVSSSDKKVQEIQTGVALRTTPVVPEEVTTQNAHKMAQALWDELDSEVPSAAMQSEATSNHPPKKDKGTEKKKKGR